MSEADTLVRCGTCARELRVVLRDCLTIEWPQCCGSTMPLIETPGPDAIDAAVAEMCRMAGKVRHGLA